MATKRSQTAKDVKKSVNKAVDNLDNQSHIAGNIMRRAVLAYLGLYGVAYDEAQTRVQAFRENRKDWFDRLVEKGEEMEVQASELMEDAQARVEENTAKLREALNFGDNVVELKVKTKKPAAKKTTAKKATAKKTTAKKPAAKKTVAKKPTAKKATVKTTTVKKEAGKKATVKTTTTKIAETKTPAKKVEAKKAEVSVKAEIKTAPKETTQAALELTPKTAPKADKETVTSVTGTEVKPETADKYADYLADALRYDSKATKTDIKKIVDHCGIALSSQDGMYVACSDETERNTVRDSWMKKKLSIEGTDEALDKKVMDVCEQMKDDRMKKRVTFYYLVAKNEGALMFL